MGNMRVTGDIKCHQVAVPSNAGALQLVQSLDPATPLERLTQCHLRPKQSVAFSRPGGAHILPPLCPPAPPTAPVSCDHAVIYPPNTPHPPNSHLVLPPSTLPPRRPALRCHRQSSSS
jgi:hypothetical protein